MEDLKGKVAIVTGAARGIGKAIATELASKGTKVVIADILDEQANETSQELNDKGFETSVFKINLRSLDEIKGLVKYTVDTYGGLDVLVNCAAIQIRKASVNFTEEDWDFINDVNQKAPFFLSQEAAKVMLPKGSGSIINISSGTSIRYTSRRVPYNLTKAAVNAMSGALGNEWARFGVRVNAVAPGWNATEMVKAGLRNGTINEGEIMPMVPINRFLDPSEIAHTVAFLASDVSSGVVGQTIFCDGAHSLRCIPETNDWAYDEDPGN